MKRRTLVPRPSLPAYAFQVWKKLRENDFECFFTGGWVRDSLLKRECEDIDLATSATPDEVGALFPHTLGLGKRFGSLLVLLQEGNVQNSVEVTTFRRDGPYLDGRRPQTIFLSGAQEDAQRRDFTLNGLFYDPETGEVIDYVEGLEDLEKGSIRAIGCPLQRFQEDRLRILRAIRFATRFGYTIEPSTLEAMQKSSHSILPSVSPERIWQELSKIDKEGSFVSASKLFGSVGLLHSLFSLDISATTLAERLERIVPQLPLMLKLLLLWDHGKEFSQESLVPLRSLKKSRYDLALLESFQSGLALLDEGKNPLQSFLWLEWCWKTKEDFLPLTTLLTILRPKQAPKTLWKEVELHPLLLYMREKGALFKAVDLEKWKILPGPSLGKILRWLHIRSAESGSVEKRRILTLLEEDPEGMLLLQKAKKENEHEP